MFLLAKAALTSTNYTRKKSDETHAALNVVYRTLFIQKMYDSSELSFTDVPNIEEGYPGDFFYKTRNILYRFFDKKSFTLLIAMTDIVPLFSYNT